MGAAKSVENLYSELRKGSCKLEDNGGLHRVVEAVSICVSYKRTVGLHHFGEVVLVETHEKMTTGNVRNLNRLLGTKLRSSESWEDAVARALTGIGLGMEGAVRVAHCGTDEEVQESPSYPGLSTKYKLHHLTAAVQIPLPERLGQGPSLFLLKYIRPVS